MTRRNGNRSIGRCGWRCWTGDSQQARGCRQHGSLRAILKLRAEQSPKPTIFCLLKVFYAELNIKLPPMCVLGFAAFPPTELKTATERFARVIDELT